MRSLASVSTPLPLMGPTAPRPAAARPSIQAKNTPGSVESIRTGPVNATLRSATASLPPIRIWVPPGARHSKLSMDQPSARLSASPRSMLIEVPAMVRLSTPRVTRTGGGDGPDARLSAMALTTSNGKRRSAPVKMRSRSICRAARVTADRGRAPNSNFAVPERCVGRASGPYWNSRSSAAAPAEVALTLAVTFQGSWMAVVPSGSAAPTTRDKVIAPSKRGAFASTHMVPSVSNDTADADASTNRRSFTLPSSPRRPLPMRNA